MQSYHKREDVEGSLIKKLFCLPLWPCIVFISSCGSSIRDTSGLLDSYSAQNSHSICMYVCAWSLYFTEQMASSSLHVVQKNGRYNSLIY